MRTELSGHFISFEAVDALTGQRRNLIPNPVDNLILDTGLNFFASGAGEFGAICMVGSGSTTPDVAQTAMQTLVAHTNNVTATSVGTNLGAGYAYKRKTYRFNVGAAAGNLSEVGVGWASTNAFCRARIVDGGGTPTTITVLSTEYLDVTYELRAYWPTVDGTATITLDGTSHSVVSRARAVGSWETWLGDIGSSKWTIMGTGCYSGVTAGTLGAVTANIPGTEIGAGPLDYDGAYVNNSYERKYMTTFIPSGISSGFSSPTSSFEGLSFTLPWGLYKAVFDPAIAKTNTKTLVLNFKHSFARRVI